MAKAGNNPQITQYTNHQQEHDRTSYNLPYGHSRIVCRTEQKPESAAAPCINWLPVGAWSIRLRSFGSWFWLGGRICFHVPVFAFCARVFWRSHPRHRAHHRVVRLGIPEPQFDPGRPLWPDSFQPLRRVDHVLVYQHDHVVFRD